VTPRGARRMYELQETPLSEMAEWLQRQRRFWEGQLEALDEAMASLPAEQEEEERS
jgi:hypothetical protein